MANYYIANTGLDGGAGVGTQANPWRTIAYAKAHSSNGDTFYLNGGDIFRETVDQTSSAKRVLRSYGTGRASICGADNFSGDGSTLKWVAAGSGTNEWELQSFAGSDPSLNGVPPFLLLNGSLSPKGTAGALADLNWATKLTGVTEFPIVMNAETTSPASFTSTVIDSGNTFAATTDAPQNGARAYRATFAGGTSKFAYGIKSFTAATDVYARFYCDGTSFDIPSTDNWFIPLVFMAGTLPAAAVLLVRTATPGVFGVHMHVQSPWTQTLVASSVNFNIPHWIEFRFRSGGATGGTELWLDGTTHLAKLDMTITADSGNDHTHVDSIRIGAADDVWSGLAVPSGTLDIDDVVVSTTGPIGVYNAGGIDGTVSGYTTLIVRDNAGDPDTTGLLVEVPKRNNCILTSGTFDFDLDGVDWYGATGHGLLINPGIGSHLIGNFRVHHCRFNGTWIGRNLEDLAVSTCTLFGDVHADYNGNTGIGVNGNMSLILASTCQMVADHNCWEPNAGDTSSAGFRMVWSENASLVFQPGSLIHAHHNGVDDAGALIGSPIGSRGVWFDTVRGQIGSVMSQIGPIITHHNHVGFDSEAGQHQRIHNVISYANLNHNYLMYNSTPNVNYPAAVVTTDMELMHCLSYGSDYVGLFIGGTYGYNTADTIQGAVSRNNVSTNNQYNFLMLNGADNTNNSNGRGSGNVYTHLCAGVEPPTGGVIALYRWAYVDYNTAAAFAAVHTPAADTLVSKDPQFLDAANGDFRLRVTSPLRGNGRAATVPLYDFLGVPRQARPTIGPYELPPAAVAGATGLGI